MSALPGPVMLQVTVVFARVDGYWSIPLQLPGGATVADALAQARSDPRFEQARAETAGLAIFGRVVSEQSRLHDGDRVELLRALVADPKQARRERAAGPKRKP